MIRALLEHVERYYVFGEGVRMALEYIRGNDLLSLAPGRYPIDENRVFALIQEPTTQSRDRAPFENHKRHADLQATLRGVEYVGYCPIGKLTPEGDYNAETDVQLYSGERDLLMRKPFLVSLVSLFSGAELFSLGLIGEYLARMYVRTMDRPVYLVAERSAAAKTKGQGE